MLLKDRGLAFLNLIGFTKVLGHPTRNSSLKKIFQNLTARYKGMLALLCSNKLSRFCFFYSLFYSYHSYHFPPLPVELKDSIPRSRMFYIAVCPVPTYNFDSHFERYYPPMRLVQVTKHAQSQTVSDCFSHYIPFWSHYTLRTIPYIERPCQCS